MADWILQFHNLEGVTIAEKKKNLNKFIKNISPKQVGIFLRELEPKTYLETLFKVDILIHFRKHSELLALLKGGNEVIASKIIKQQWFFQEAFNIVDEEQFVSEFLPQFSQSIKMKVLKNISLVLNELQVDTLFDQVSKRYGLHHATIMLPKCSKKKIEFVMNNSKVRLSSTQLRQIFIKYPDFVVSYLINYKEDNKKNYFNNNKFLTYLSKYDPDKFWKICESCDWIVRLGRRTTKKQLCVKKNDLIKCPVKYLPYFRKDRLVREMTKNNFNEFVQLYEKIFPDTVSKVQSIDTVDIIKHLPKYTQFPLFSNTYLKVLGEPITKNTLVINHKLLQLIKDESLREELAQTKYKETHEERFWLYYKKENAIKLIKEKMNITSGIKGREGLVILLMQVCSLDNDDLATLEDILAYFCKRHNTNDARNIRVLFLTQLSYSFKIKNLVNFTERHWQYIYQIINCHQVHEQQGTMDIDRLIVNYLQFIYKSGQPIRDSWKAHLTWRCNGKFYNNLFKPICEYLINPDLEKELFLLCVEFVPVVVDNTKDYSRWKYLVCDLVCSIQAHNRKNPQHTIVIRDNSILTELLTYLMERPMPQNPDRGSIIFNVDFLRFSICKRNRNDFEEKMVDHFYCYAQHDKETLKIIHWFVKNQPQKFGQYLNKILEHVDIYKCLPWHLIKQYSHLGMAKAVTDCCLKKVETQEYKNNVAIPLAIILPTQEYLNLVEKYVPTNFIMDMNDREEANKIKIRCDFALNLKRMFEKEKALELLFQFTHGDYFQHILPAIHSFFHKIPEQNLYPFIGELLKRKKEPIKKQCIYLSIMALKEETIIRIFNQITDIKSLHKYMFKSLLILCNKSSSETIFCMLICYMKKLQKIDIESLHMVENAELPRKFRVEFMTEGWNYFEALRENDIESSEFDQVQLSFLSNNLYINKDLVTKLSPEFCKTLLNKYFLKIHTFSHCYAIQIFAYKFMLLNEENFKFIFDIISKLKIKCWEHNSLKVIFFNFFSHMKECISHLDVDDKIKFIIKYKTHWVSIFSQTETFKEHVILDLRLAYLRCDQPILQNYSRAIVELIKSIVSEFGDFIYSIYFQILKDEINQCIKSENLLELFFNIMSVDETSSLVSILVIDLLYTVNYYDINVKSQHLYQQIVNKLKINKNEIIIFKYNMFQRENNILCNL